MTSAAFDALGDATRRQILEVLAAGEQPVGAVVEAMRSRTSISQPAVSQHLKVLRAAGLVTTRPEGTRRLHAIRPAGFDVVTAWLDDLVGRATPFRQPLDALATEVERGKRSRRRAAAPSAPAAGTGS